MGLSKGFIDEAHGELKARIHGYKMGAGGFDQYSLAFHRFYGNLGWPLLSEAAAMRGGLSG